MRRFDKMPERIVICHYEGQHDPDGNFWRGGCVDSKDAENVSGNDPLFTPAPGLLVEFSFPVCPHCHDMAKWHQETDSWYCDCDEPWESRKDARALLAGE